MIGIPTLLANGNLEVYYQIDVENNGAVDLADLGLVCDLETLFGPGVLKNASSLTVVTPPTNANSSITLDPSGWDGTAATDAVDQAVTTNLLAMGDSFVIGFKVEIDASAASGVLDNTATVVGTAVNSSGVPFTDAAGNRITASDDTDSGADPSDSNFGEPDETSGSADPVTLSVQKPLSVPSVALTKTASDAIANGGNWDVEFTIALENTGTVAIDKVEIYDDLANMFGGQFAGVTLDRVTARSRNKGSALIANAGFTADTSRSLVTSTGPVEVGDAFEVVFTVTIDPKVAGTAASGLDSQASAVCEAVDNNGRAITNLVRSSAIADDDSAHDDRDNGIALAGESAEANLDGTLANTPTPVVLPNIAVVKSVTGTALPLANGNFEVIYRLVIANTGTVDLAELTLVEDFSDQIGSALVSAGKVTLATPPSDVSSSVALDSSWNGSGAGEIIDQAHSTLLAVGDSFSVQFTVEVDPNDVGSSSKLESQVILSGEAVEVAEVAEEVGPNGEQLIVSGGGESLATDLSNTIVAPYGDNLAAPSDEGTGDDPTPLYLADLAIAKAVVGDPVLTDRGNYVVTYQIVIENTGNVDLASLSLSEDLSAQFGRPLVKAGNLSISSGPSDAGSSVSVDSASWNGKISTELLDVFAPNVLVTGDSFTVQFEIEINPSVATAPLESLVRDSIRTPGTIYSGIPIDQIASQSTFDGGRAAAGYSANNRLFAASGSTTDDASSSSIMTMPFE